MPPTSFPATVAIIGPCEIRRRLRGQFHGPRGSEPEYSYDLYQKDRRIGTYPTLAKAKEAARKV